MSAVFLFHLSAQNQVNPINEEENEKKRQVQTPLVKVSHYIFLGK